MSAPRNPLPEEKRRKAGRPRNPDMPQPRSYRLPAEVVALVKRLRIELGVTEAVVIERAVRLLAGDQGTTGPPGAPLANDDRTELKRLRAALREARTEVHRLLDDLD